ncbi:zf-TFIIB domain-containing protein [Castellaniella sp.]|uniref:TFIIB-type zinc ribbon-containing protein n=1 Tax=Castellaniella sp. TaxID=1955812 RepID=UPI003A90ECDC
MKCPVCPDVNLVMSSRQNIEIDYCPQCRGVWLDRGELDKLIERSTSEAPPAMPHAATPQQAPQHYGDRDRHGGHNRYPQGRRKKSLWGEIFDFD